MTRVWMVKSCGGQSGEVALSNSEGEVILRQRVLVSADY